MIGGLGNQGQRPHQMLPGGTDRKWWVWVGALKYLYVQVEDTVAVQIVQPLGQLLDVDLDLQQRQMLT